VNVYFKDVTITGSITTATAEHILMNGEEITMETPEFYYLIGEVNNIFCSKPEDPHGVAVSLDAKSKWIVDRTSYITDLNIAKDGTITTRKGYRVTMTVDGVVKEIKAGQYKGQIVLTVTKV
jgi:hypothetical protein